MNYQHIIDKYGDPVAEEVMGVFQMTLVQLNRDLDMPAIVELFNSMARIINRDVFDSPLMEYALEKNSLQVRCNDAIEAIHKCAAILDVYDHSIHGDRFLEEYIIENLRVYRESLHIMMRLRSKARLLKTDTAQRDHVFAIIVTIACVPLSFTTWSTRWYTIGPILGVGAVVTLLAPVVRNKAYNCIRTTDEAVVIDKPNWFTRQVLKLYGYYEFIKS